MLLHKRLICAAVHFKRRVFITAVDGRSPLQRVSVKRNDIIIKDKSVVFFRERRIFFKYLVYILTLCAIEHEKHDVLMIF